MKLEIPKLKAVFVADILFKYQPVFGTDIEHAMDKIDKCWPPDSWRKQTPYLTLPTTEKEKSQMGFRFNAESPAVKNLLRDLIKLGAKEIKEEL
jgi:hypothetical protein